MQFKHVTSVNTGAVLYQLNYEATHVNYFMVEYIYILLFFVIYVMVSTISNPVIKFHDMNKV